MSTVTVQFIGLCANTLKRKTAIHVYTTDIEFNDKAINNVFYEQFPEHRKVFAEKLVITAFEYADDWVLSIDKLDIMHKYDFHIINNWKILQINNVAQPTVKLVKQVVIDSRIAVGGKYKLTKPTAVENKVLNMIDLLVQNVQMQNDMLACYVNIHDSIRHLSYREQFDIILSSTDTAYKSALNTLQGLKEYGKRLNAIPKEVWRAAFRQGNLTTEDFIKQYLDGTLDTNKYLN